MSTWDAGVTGNDLTHYAVMLAPGLLQLRDLPKFMHIMSKD